MRKTDSRTERVETGEDLPRFEFLAGRLSLDFCNTHSRANGGDRLGDATGLAAWAARGGRALAGTPAAADLARFRSLRDHLCRLFDAVINRAPPAAVDLDAVALAAHAGGVPALRWDAAAGRAVPAAMTDSPDRLYADIAADAVDLLTGAALARLKRCPSDTCHWFFFDQTRNGRRRWCAMADCGTRAKVRDYRARRRQTDPGF